MKEQPRSTTGHHWWEPERRRTTAVQQGATAAGWLFLLLGVMGFIPLFTPGFSGISFAGNDTTAELFGVFEVSVLTNLLHLVYGVTGLIMGWMVGASVRYLITGGVFFALLGLYGLIVPDSSTADFLPSNWPIALLHLGLGILVLLLGLLMPRTLPKESEARGEGDFGETNRGAAR
ncbi:DUF4383 domain-containing protein [Glycomyces sp. TRM65418]|uniref:DUF4383 domain-containing protein n=1 Tax=Glycomyces sp. TRM65418 TaxID=2867006 RepID=UPI001CE4F4EF|nr:DUF4383 domain-containing protein [Glycomyces sp. TRM65418]MCC3762048.1 DUF4383 domain-containing protein [Glycomyces sp. TRM65418]QZD56119.1 DUF4383 domain-containing protein [Glycomyces sp. TRM65418]